MLKLVDYCYNTLESDFEIINLFWIEPIDP